MKLCDQFCVSINPVLPKKYSFKLQFKEKYITIQLLKFFKIKIRDAISVQNNKGMIVF